MNDNYCIWRRSNIYSPIEESLESSIPKDHVVEHFSMSLHGLICVVIMKHDVLEV